MWTKAKLKNLLIQLRSFLMPENEIGIIMRAANTEMKAQQRSKLNTLRG